MFCSLGGLQDPPPSQLFLLQLPLSLHFSFQPEENSFIPCIPLTFQLWVYLLYLSLFINMTSSSSSLAHGCLPACLHLLLFPLSLHTPPSPLPHSFPACSSGPVEAGGSPEPSTPSRGPPAQPCWLAGSLALLQHTHTHTHTFFSSLLTCCLSLASLFQPLPPSVFLLLFSHFYSSFHFNCYYLNLKLVPSDVHRCCVSFYMIVLPQR